MKKTDTISSVSFFTPENPKGLFQLLVLSIYSKHIPSESPGRTAEGNFKQDVSPLDAPTSHVANSTYRSLVSVGPLLQ